MPWLQKKKTRKEKGLSYPIPLDDIHRGFLQLLSITVTIYLVIVTFVFSIITPQPFLTDWMIWGYTVVVSIVALIGGLFLKRRQLKKTFLYSVIFLLVVIGLGTGITSGIMSGLFADLWYGLLYGFLFGLLDCVCLIVFSLVGMIIRRIIRKPGLAA